MRLSFGQKSRSTHPRFSSFLWVWEGIRSYSDRKWSCCRAQEAACPLGLSELTDFVLPVVNSHVNLLQVLPHLLFELLLESFLSFELGLLLLLFQGFVHSVALYVCLLELLLPTVSSQSRLPRSYFFSLFGSAFFFPMLDSLDLLSLTVHLVSLFELLEVCVCV